MKDSGQRKQKLVGRKQELYIVQLCNIQNYYITLYCVRLHAITLKVYSRESPVRSNMMSIVL